MELKKFLPKPILIDHFPWNLFLYFQNCENYQPIVSKISKNKNKNKGYEKSLFQMPHNGIQQTTQLQTYGQKKSY